MNYREHLVLGAIPNIIFILIITFLFKVDIFQDYAFPLIITFFIFSLLPDIDHSYSKISIMFIISLICLVVYSVIEFFKSWNFLLLLGILLGIGGLVLHFWYAEDSYTHRRIPHTFTFGILACIVLFFIVNSIWVVIVGFISFFTHIFLDGHIREALEKDKKIWKTIFYKIKKL